MPSNNPSISSPFILVLFNTQRERERGPRLILYPSLFPFRIAKCAEKRRASLLYVHPPDPWCQTGSVQPLPSQTRCGCCCCGGGACCFVCFGFCTIVVVVVVVIVVVLVGACCFIYFGFCTIVDHQTRSLRLLRCS